MVHRGPPPCAKTTHFQTRGSAGFNLHRPTVRHGGAARSPAAREGADQPPSEAGQIRGLEGKVASVPSVAAQVEFESKS
jgi:hypothetical protein